MDDLKYIVLRTERLSVPERGTVGRPGLEGFGGGARTAPEKLELSNVALTKNERDDLRRDPRTKAIATPMPLKLIEPTNNEEPAANALAANVTWGVEAVGATQSAFDGSGIKVAVLDTGIDPNHPAFQGVNLVRRNFTSEGDDDTNGHGTHCAGTIFGRDVNGLRIGVATGVTDAIIGKVLGNGGGSSGDLVEAIQWAVEQGANVVSMSLGIDFPGFVKHLVDNFNLPVEAATSIGLEQYRANINLFSSLADLISNQNAIQEGSMVVAASGNESNRPVFEIAVAPPAAATGILSVGALAEGGNDGHVVADFSNTRCDVSAPGVAVISAAPGGGLRSLSGTSMATPHVAGCAALWAQRQVSQSGGIRADVLNGQLLAMASKSPIVAGASRDDIGEGLVKAP